MVEPFFDRSKAIYREGLYRSLEIFSNHVNNSGGCTHNPAEHSPTTTPSLPLQRCVVISHCRYRFHGWQRNLEAGIVAGNPPPQIPLVVCARFAEERRRIRAGRLIRPPTKILGRRFTRNRSLHSTPRLLHPPRLGGERTTARFVSLPFFLSLSLSSRSFVFPYFSVLLSSFPPLPRSLAEVGSRRLNLILNHSAAFTWYRDVTRERERDKGMEILTLARLPRGLIVSWPLIGLIGRWNWSSGSPPLPTFFWSRGDDWGILETGQFVVYACKIIGGFCSK